MSITKYKKLGLTLGFAVILLSLMLAVFLPVWAEDPDLSTTYFTVNVTSSNQNYGAVSVTGTNKNENGAFLYGTKVYLEAQPTNDCYRFVRWEGDNGRVSTSSRLELIVGDGVTSGTTHSYTAIFEPMAYPITIAEDSRVSYASGDQLPEYHVYGSITVLPTPLDTPAYTFEGWIVESGGKEQFYQKGTSLGANDITDAVLLTAKFNPKPFTVAIYDVPEQLKSLYNMISFRDEIDLAQILNSSEILISSEFGASVNPADQAVDYYRMYRGYYFIKAEGAYRELAEVSTNPNTNFAIRYFTPKTYQIVYDGLEGATLTGSPTTHTYGTTTTILNPTKLGYTFAGWRMLQWNGTEYVCIRTTDNLNNLQIQPTEFDTEEWTVENQTDREVSIILEAQWTVNVYDVDYEGVSAEQESALNKQRPFDQDFPLSNTLTRTGYTFLGWRIKDSGNAFVMDFSIPASSIAQDLVIEAGWQANDYTVTLDPDAADAVAGDTTVTVTFDGQFPDTMLLPTREGYTFLGYYSDHSGRGKGYYYYDEESDSWIRAISDISTDTQTLYAYWRINKMTVTIDSSILKDQDDHVIADVTVNGIPYTGTPLAFDYNTPITVVVTMKENYKLVKWNGADIAHTRSFTAEAFKLKEDITLGGAYATAQATPAFVVDYRNEIFKVNADGSLPAGSYKLVYDSTEVRFTVAADGTVTFADATTASRLFAEDYFGKTVWITLCGDGVNSADSDAQQIAVAARPQKPSDDLSKGDIDHISALDYSILIVMNANRPYTYEFAISRIPSPDGVSGLTWTTDPSFTGLNGGTPYHIYIRVAASDTHPHGEVYYTVRNTLPDQYRQLKIDDLMNLGGQAGDGENVAKLLEDAKKQMQELQPSADFVDRLQEILDAATAKIAFARVQDKNISDLLKLLNSLKQTAQYHEVDGIAQLDACYQAAKADIIAATTEGEVLRIYASGEAALYAVPVTYLYYPNSTDKTVTLASGGMDRGYALSISRVQELSDISAKIQRAIAANTFAVDPNCAITLADVERMLGSLDVLGYYTLTVRHADPSVAKPNGPFEVRLLIPEDLREETGFLVAYQSDASGLTILQTRREGNELIFVADSVQNFVILGDHAVNLTWLIAALGATLLCQLVALAILLVRRQKLAKELKHYGIAFPALALTVRFFPENSLKVVILLAALVVILQLVLLWLLLKSDLIYRKKKSELTDPAVPASPADAESAPTAEEPTVADGDEEPAFVAAPMLVEEEMYEEPFYGDEAGEEPDLADAPLFEADPEPEMTELEAEDYYGDNSFIEPAAVPHYALPDEEFDPAFAPADEDAYDEDAEASDGDMTDGAAYAYNEVIDQSDDYSEAAAAEAVFDDEAEYTDEDYAEDEEYAPFSYDDTDGALDADAEGEAFAYGDYADDTLAYQAEDAYEDPADGEVTDEPILDEAFEQASIEEPEEITEEIFEDEIVAYSDSDFDISVYEADAEADALNDVPTDAGFIGEELADEDRDDDTPIQTY